MIPYGKFDAEYKSDCVLFKIKYSLKTIKIKLTSNSYIITHILFTVEVLYTFITNWIQNLFSKYQKVINKLNVKTLKIYKN